MTYLSNPRFSVLHALRIKGLATTAGVSAVSGLPPALAEGHLRSMSADGLVCHRQGRINGWALTDRGRHEHRQDCAAELAAAACRAAVDDGYRQFTAVNEPFLSLCTDWQLRASAPGGPTSDGHADRGDEAAVLGRLGLIDDLVQPLCIGLGMGLARLGRYSPRLAAARTQVEAGNMEWFTGVLVESYHTVWFELHEDLLATLAIDRAKEAAR
jgi:hypothetical protein